MASEYRRQKWREQKERRELRYPNYYTDYNRKRYKDPAIRERLIKNIRVWRSENMELLRLYGRRRRAAEYHAPGFHTLEQWIMRVQYYGWRCAYCGKLLDVHILTQDHWIPLSRGGSHFASNLVPACLSCNSSKHNRRGVIPVLYVMPRLPK